MFTHHHKPFTTIPLAARCAVALGFALATGAAAAAEVRSFSFSRQALAASGGASVSAASVVLPATGSPTIQMDFVLPRDYLRNGKVSIVLYLSTLSAPCNARIVPQKLVRLRPGTAGVDDLTGLSSAGGSDLAAFNFSGEIVQKVFTLERNAAFVGGQRASDGFVVGVQRTADDAADTCTNNIFVQAIDIRYPLAP